MEEKKRTLLAVLISVTILAAVLYSFGVSFFRSTPEIIVADPSLSSGPSSDEDPGANRGEIAVEVTPRTVQNIIASMSRYGSYSRDIEIRYAWSDAQSAVLTARVVEVNGWVRCDTVLPGGIVEHSILGDVGHGSLWYWYDEEADYLHSPAGEGESDLVQHIPTYEDILEADVDAILDTDYTEKNGEACVYVDVAEENGRMRYWVSMSSGLLVAAEREQDGLVVYAMTSGDVVSPAAADADTFALPDGTVLYEGAG